MSSLLTDVKQTEEFYGHKKLYWYQVAARNAIIAELQSGTTRICVVQPTGSGKTLTIACSLSDPHILKALHIDEIRPLRVLFSSHKHRLLTQAEQTFADSNNVHIIPHSIFSDIPEDAIKNGWDITVLDECHHEGCMTFQYQLDNLGSKPIIGLTATPDRSDGLLIKFESIINPISREQAVEEGFLAPTFLNTIVDTPAKNKVPITKMIIDEFGAEFGQTMMFFSTKQEVRDITEYLTTLGYKAVAILTQTNKQLNALLNDFSEGKVQFLLNCNKINEGVDVKGCSDVYLGKQFGSYSQLSQVIGRASRPDCDCRVWELINPISGRNLDTTVVVGTPERHRLISKKQGIWITQEFDYASNDYQVLEYTPSVAA